jgi:hypothetical protein
MAVKGKRNHLLPNGMPILTYLTSQLSSIVITDTIQIAGVRQRRLFPV